MVKTRQKRVIVFEFQEGSTEEIKCYIEQNKDLLLSCCLAFHDEISDDVKALLQNLKMNYFILQNDNFLKQPISKEAVNSLLPNSEIKHNEVKPSKVISLSLDKNDKSNVITTTKDSNIKQVAQAPIKIPLHKDALPCKMFKKAIRSGEELVLHSHNVFLKDVHSGAFIKSYGNLEIYGKCEGNLECLGEFIIIKHFCMGRISLQNVILEGKMLEILKNDNKIKMIYIENGEINILPLD